MLKQQKNYLKTEYHTPVMLNECLEGLNINPKGHYVDVTFGGGGHSRAILDRLNFEGRLYAFDRDSDAKNNLIENDSRFIFIDENFSSLYDNLRLYRAFEIDGILADLGVSSFQIDTPKRGFSTRFDAPLDLRMNTEQVLSAKEVINQYEREDLKRIFKSYGELSNATLIAKKICERRETMPINTTFELKDTILTLAPKNQENKFFAMVFQALRIEVNDELGSLRLMLEQSAKVLKPNGRLVVMSYHSLEDRLVKNFMKFGNFEANAVKDFYGNLISPFEMITKKPIEASSEENDTNPRSRSAKLRIAIKR
ncbi:MAG: 16S rRNA (cytosine(1402)-N(4))-methyltransferase RsmH [Bacteroidales bacterium]|nr:16S rRNA (cytosine(1402)-N(4))-methyltransferase RsmH [Bacteroidales bacterium]MDD4703319.1 16S rRNA (cytosine(1402)-N(4))-methyltransferase RsmH [Bacteroidales bacterium]MDX9798316.1 16S rRNA (cytosine(1402)-N(4))-methyltransferase RsmH [Bacteroidales bacterium]